MQWSVLVNELLDRLVLTQGELAEHCGVGQQSVSAWKLGQRTPCTVARRRLLEMARKEGVEQTFYSTAEVPPPDADVEEHLERYGTSDGAGLEDMLKDAPNDLRQEVLDFALFKLERQRNRSGGQKPEG